MATYDRLLEQRNAHHFESQFSVCRDHFSRIVLLNPASELMTEGKFGHRLQRDNKEGQ